MLTNVVGTNRLLRLAEQSGARFLLRLAIWVPEDKADACLATVANTAGQLNLKCTWSKQGA